MSAPETITTADAAAAVSLGAFDGTGVTPPRRARRSTPPAAADPEGTARAVPPAPVDAPVLPARPASRPPAPAPTKATPTDSGPTDSGLGDGGTSDVGPVGTAGDQPQDRTVGAVLDTGGTPKGRAGSGTGSAKRTRGRPTNRAGGQLRRTSKARIPAELVKMLKRRKTSAAACGQRFVISDWVAQAVGDLPTAPGPLLRLLERWAGELNLGLREGEEGWNPVDVFSTGLPPETEMRIWQMVDGLLERDDLAVKRQDLIALAILVRQDREAHDTAVAP